MTTARKFAYLRIAFGFVWAVDAALKWEPTFRDYATIPLFHIDPHIAGTIIALIESALALGLIFGLFTRQALLLGGLFSLSISVLVEKFGMFWMPGSVDIGASIIYVLVFIALLIGKSWEELSLDASRRPRA